MVGSGNSAADSHGSTPSSWQSGTNKPVREFRETPPVYLAPPPPRSQKRPDLKWLLITGTSMLFLGIASVVAGFAFESARDLVLIGIVVSLFAAVLLAKVGNRLG
jgi:hypothetical protein